MMEKMTIRVACRAEPVIKNLERIVTRIMADRHWPRPVFISGQEPADVELTLCPGIATEGFRIETGPEKQVLISASDPRGLFYGMGKFLRQCSMKDGDFLLCPWRGLSEPQTSMRGIYFATHFHNYYQEAPLAEVQAYIEELALLGINALTVWFDMHHFQGIDDPAAETMLERLRELLRAAKGAGMSAGISVLANEGYSTTPARLRATKTGRAHYGVEVCVATPEGEKLVLDNLRGELEAFRDIELDRLSLWPYDQGGCSCALCAPWGSRGMLKIGEKAAHLFRSFFPKGKIVYSTWLFGHGKDQGEWEGLARAFAKKPDWVDFIQADSHREFPRFPLDHGVPGGLPLLNFPEISMYGMAPWGGVGANPLLRRFSTLWNEVAHLADGGFPYSEGIFEDINKAAYAHFYWTGRNDPREAVAEYAAFEFGGAPAEQVSRILDILESNHGPRWLWPSTMKLWGYPKTAVPLEGYPGWKRVPLPPTASAAHAAEASTLCEQLEADMPDWAKQSWRWRIVKLRAFLDRELIGNGGAPTPACAAMFIELEKLFHARHGETTVSPPVPGRQRSDSSAA